MLSPSSTDVVKATLPAIGAAIGDITPLFYRKMFDAHPELERDLFNRGNQKAGDQPRALAASIATYATVLVTPDAPAPLDLLRRIGHKHASLGIKPEEYEIVHTHLFAAIVEVLGEAVTPEVAAAWDEVYWLMANDLITLEKELYAEAGVTPETVWRDVVVTERRQESPDTVSFTLAGPDGSPLATAKPGQYISVAVRLPDGARQIRQYSLTRAAAGQWAFSVKAIAASVAEDGTEIPEGEVSNFLHRTVFEGDTLTTSVPFGDLVLDDSDDPLLLVSAGIGSTPILGMLNYLSHTGSNRRVTVLHADRSLARHAHRQQLSALVDTLPDATLHRWYEELGDRGAATDVKAGRVDLAGVEIQGGARAYLCGPLPFMQAVRSDLVDRGVAADRIHYEVFGPDKWVAAN